MGGRTYDNPDEVARALFSRDKQNESAQAPPCGECPGLKTRIAELEARIAEKDRLFRLCTRNLHVARAERDHLIQYSQDDWPRTREWMGRRGAKFRKRAEKAETRAKKCEAELREAQGRVVMGIAKTDDEDCPFFDPFAMSACSHPKGSGACQSECPDEICPLDTHPVFVRRKKAADTK